MEPGTEGAAARLEEEEGSSEPHVVSPPPRTSGSPTLDLGPALSHWPRDAFQFPGNESHRLIGRTPGWKLRATFSKDDGGDSQWNPRCV